MSTECQFSIHLPIEACVTADNQMIFQMLITCALFKHVEHEIPQILLFSLIALK